MRIISELFEFLSNCENETILKEVRIQGERLIRQEGSKAATILKLDIEKLNTLLRLSEWFLTEEFHSALKEFVPEPEVDEIMTVKEAAKYLKTTTQNAEIRVFRIQDLTVVGFDWGTGGQADNRTRTIRNYELLFTVHRSIFTTLSLFYSDIPIYSDIMRDGK